jgi:hypothetical protein
MLDAAFAQPLKNRSLRRLALVPQRIVHVTTLFSFCAQSRCPAQVGLVSEHNEEFSLLPIPGMLHHPRRNLDICAIGYSSAIVLPGSRFTLTDGARGSDSPQYSHAGCDE